LPAMSHRRSFHLELVLKVCLRRDMTGSFVSSPTFETVDRQSRPTFPAASQAKPQAGEVST